MKKKYKKTQNRKKKAPTNKTLAKEIKHIKNDLMETKWFDTYAIVAARTSPQSNNHLISIAQGDQPYQRNGDKIYTSSLQLRLSIVTPIGQRSPVFIRCIIYWDRQSNMLDNAVVTTGGDQTALLETSLLGVPAYLAPMNFLAIDRYTVLYDKVYQVEQNAIASFNPSTGNETATHNSPVHKEIFLKIARNVKYGSSGGYFPVTNSLKVAFMSNVVGADEAPLVTFASRTYFRDA